MKSRLAILGMLVAGMLLSTAGAGMAISGLSGDDASVAQYGRGNDNNNAGGRGGGGGAVLPEQGENQGVAGAGADNAGGGGGAGLQPSRQVEAGADSGGGGALPFTGLAAIPILLGGVALLTTGMILRRRTHDDES